MYSSRVVSSPDKGIQLRPRPPAVVYTVGGLQFGSQTTAKLGKCSLKGTEDDGALLMEMLRENRTLKELDLSDNGLCIISVLGYIVKGLRHNTGSVKLLLGKCSLKLTEDDGPLLEDILRENKLMLKKLDLTGNPICPTALGYAAKGLRHYTGLVKVSLQKCGLQLTEGNGSLLEEMLRENRTLKEVNLFTNVLGKHTDALGYIAKGLRYNTGL